MAIDHAVTHGKVGLKIPLATDPDGSACRAFGTCSEGDNSVGFQIKAATFLIGPDSTIDRIWRNVDAHGHAAEVIEAARELKGEGS